MSQAKSGSKAAALVDGSLLRNDLFGKVKQHSLIMNVISSVQPA